MVVTENHATGSAGGIFGNNGPVTLTNSVISDNTADFDVGGILGARLTIINGTISGNSANRVGGIQVNKVSTGSSSISGSFITNNSASSEAGGIQIGGPVTITNSTISGNTGGKGGGMKVSAESVSLTDVTIADNTATSISGGGGIWTECCALPLNNVTVVRNNATAGPGRRHLLYRRQRYDNPHQLHHKRQLGRHKRRRYRPSRTLQYYACRAEQRDHNR